jgi:hypothetical protein
MIDHYKLESLLIKDYESNRISLLERSAKGLASLSSMRGKYKNKDIYQTFFQYNCLLKRRGIEEIFMQQGVSAKNYYCEIANFYLKNIREHVLSAYKSGHLEIDKISIVRNVNDSYCAKVVLTEEYYNSSIIMMFHEEDITNFEECFIDSLPSDQDINEIFNITGLTNVKK